MVLARYSQVSLIVRRQKHMPKDTPSMAKNKMRRCFAAILDPHPSKSDVAQLWGYFNSTCAYCGAQLERSSRTGHLDHARPTSDGGTNSIHNHVLSCARCNGDERREESWVTFLANKVTDPSLALARKAKIDAWLSRERPSPAIDPTQRKEAEAIITAVLESFDVAVEQLRKMRRMSSR